MIKLLCVFGGGPRRYSTNLMTSNQEYISSHDLSLLMLILITWLIQYLSDFSTIKLYSFSTLYGVLFGRMSLTTAHPWAVELFMFRLHLCGVVVSITIIGNPSTRYIGLLSSIYLIIYYLHQQIIYIN